MKIIVLCAALAAFCTCAAAQVATPLRLDGVHVRQNAGLQVGDEVWWIGRQTNNLRSMERTDAASGTVVRAGSLHFNTEYFQSRVLLSALGFVFYELRSNTTNLFELWRTDGTATGDVLIAEHDSRVGSAIEWKGCLFFLVNGALRRTSGAAMDAQDVFTFEYWQAGMCLAGPRLVFQTWHTGRGETTLYSTDGTTAGTTECFRAMLPNSQGGVLGEFKGHAYFYVHDMPTLVPAVSTLYRTNGLPDGTTAVAGAFPVWVQPVVRGSIMYFAAESYFQAGIELWRTDGTSAGTRAVALPTDESPASWLVEFEGEHYFTTSKYGPYYSLCKLDAAGEVKVLRQADATQEQLTPVMSWRGRLLLQGTRQGSTARLWSSTGGHGPFVAVGHNLEFEGYPITEFYGIAGTSGDKLVVIDLAPITDPILRMWLVDLDEPGYRENRGGCAASPVPGWPALALACMALPWIRRRFSLRYAARHGTIPPPASVGRASKVHL